MKSRKKNASIFESRDKAKFCFYCHKPFSDFPSGTKEIDHFIPLSKGGSNKNKNKVIGCHKCNSIKKDLTPNEFINKIEEIIQGTVHWRNSFYTREELETIIATVKNLIIRQDELKRWRVCRGYPGFFIKKIPK